MAIWPLAAVVAWNGTAEELPTPLYRNGGKWLHPLFDLLELLAGREAADPGDAGDAGDAGEAADPAADRAVAALASEGEALLAAGPLYLRDRVIGRAAAFLALRAGIRHVHADLVSDGAVAVFEAAGASIGWGERVPAIGCATEAELSDVTAAETAWSLLLARRKAAETR